MRRHRPCDLEETPVAKTPRLTDDGSDESDLSFLDASSDSLASSDSFLSSLTDSYSEEEETDELRQPLYAGANITALQSCVAMLQYKFQYSLSKKAFEELVSLIALHLPQDVQLKQSITTIRKHIDELFNDVAAKKHYYCTTFSQLLGDGEKCSDCVDAKVGTFLQVPLEPQLKRKLEDPKLWDAIQERFVNNPTAQLSDVYDGECYKKYCDQGGFLSADNPANIHVSLLMNTDGVAIFRSSTTSMWPMWIVINELPPTLRWYLVLC